MKTQAETLPPGDHALMIVSSYDGTQQPYRLYLPTLIDATSESLPLVVVLHGKTVDHNAWFDLTPIKEYGEKYGYIVAAPYGRGDYFYQGPAEQDVLDMIDEVQQRYQIAPDRIYLMGHSMGGWGTWWIGLRHPDLFASLCPMAGFSPFELLPNAGHLAPLIIHDQDDPIVSVEHSQKTVQRLQQLGLFHEYREEQGYGHESRMIGDNLDRVFQWMNHHRRPDLPRSITYVTRTPRCGKAYWIQVLETAEFPYPATLEAKLESPRKIHIQTDRIKRFALDLKKLERLSPNSLEISLDGSAFKLEPGFTWGVFSCTDSLQDWQYHPQNDPLPDYESPVIGQVSDKASQQEAQEYLLHKVGQLLLEEIDADVALFTRDMFIGKLQAGSLTADDLLAFYIYSEKRMGLMTCRGREFREILRTESPPGKEWWGKLQATGKEVLPSDQHYRVIAPLHVARTFKENPEILPKTIPEYLYRAIIKKVPFTFE